MPRKKTVTDLAKKQRQAAYQRKFRLKRSITNVNLGTERFRWEELKDKLNIDTHQEVAKVLMDSYYGMNVPSTTTSTDSDTDKRNERPLDLSTTCKGENTFQDDGTQEEEVPCIELDVVLSSNVSDDDGDDNDFNDRRVTSVDCQPEPISEIAKEQKTRF